MYLQTLPISLLFLKRRLLHDQEALLLSSSAFPIRSILPVTMVTAQSLQLGRLSTNVSAQVISVSLVVVLVYASKNHGSDFRCFSVLAKMKKVTCLFFGRIFYKKACQLKVILSNPFFLSNKTVNHRCFISYLRVFKYQGLTLTKQKKMLKTKSFLMNQFQFSYCIDSNFLKTIHCLKITTKTNI